MSLLQELGIGRHVCPKCDGGDTREKTFSVVAGVVYPLVGRCYRDKCGYRLVDGTASAPAAPAFEPRPLCKPYCLPKDRLALYGERVLRDDPDTTAWLLTSLSGQRLGATTRSKAKTIRTFREVNATMYYWNGKHIPRDRLWIFEDPRSAALCGMPAIALLGTSLAEDVAADISKLPCSPLVLVALDPGAEEAGMKAYRRLREWGVNASFVPMECDFKDMDHARREELARTYCP